MEMFLHRQVMEVEFLLSSFPRVSSEWRRLGSAECSVPALSKALSPTYSCSPDFNPLSKCLGELTAAMPSSKVLLVLGHDGRG